MALSLDLLALARVLARRERLRPKQSSLRRSVSTSYYALFHFLGGETTKLTVGGGHHQQSLRQFAQRALVHAKMKTVCNEFTKQQPSSELLRPFWAQLGVAANPDVRTVAESFIDLQ